MLVGGIILETVVIRSKTAFQISISEAMLMKSRASAR